MIEFFRGLKSKYDLSKHGQGIYFATDTKEILMLGASYTGPVKPSTTEVKGMMAWQEVVGSISQAFSQGGMVTLSEDMDVKESLVVKSGANAVLDLGGHRISNVGASKCAIRVEDGASLVIRGNGHVYGGEGTEYSCAVIAQGALTIESGVFSVGVDKNGQGNSCIYAQGGHVVINGGTFSSSAMYNGKYWVLNQQNGVSSSIIVKGGTFVNFDPANPLTDDYPSYVANGYKSQPVEGTSNFIVVEE